MSSWVSQVGCAAAGRAGAGSAVSANAPGASANSDTAAIMNKRIMCSSTTRRAPNSPDRPQRTIAADESLLCKSYTVVTTDGAPALRLLTALQFPPLHAGLEQAITASDGPQRTLKFQRMNGAAVLGALHKPCRADAAHHLSWVDTLE
jgi:hypothetical protein